MVLKQQTILLIEDNLPLARTYESYLTQANYNVTPATTASEATQYLTDSEFDIILLDILLPDGSGLDLLKKLMDKGCNSSIIMITADASIDQAIESMRVGAQDYLVKPFSADRLRTTISQVLDRRQLKKSVDLYEEEFDRTSYCDFIGSSPNMQAIYQLVDNAASSNATVFVMGESGTGKELMARALHQKSARNSRNFVALNCAAIPSELMESEIFGHVKGAFTGASENRNGAAIQADKGTLFLDEICEMDIGLQAKLLRFIQTGTFQKVGSDKLEEVDIRFVCATNRDPLTEVRAGRFRQDLYYRLNIVPVTLPPLRARNGDILELGTHFLNMFTREEDKDFQSFDPQVIEVLKQYPWEGNVRELQNIIQQIVVLNNGSSISLSMLPPQLLQTNIPNTAPLIPETAFNGDAGPHEIKPMWQIELAHIQNALAHTDNNIPKAAALLEVSPSTIYRRLKDLT
jgi:DNA-binding NtrC family response regulator